MPFMIVVLSIPVGILPSCQDMKNICSENKKHLAGIT